VTRSWRWINLAIAGLLAVLVPACWSWAIHEHGAGSWPSALGQDEDGKGDPDGKDGKDEKPGAPREFRGTARDGLASARTAAQAPPASAPVQRQRRDAHRAPAWLASAAPKPHPSRLSVRRQC